MINFKLLNDWEKKSPEEAISDFYGERWDYEINRSEKSKEFARDKLEGVEWLFGSYSYANYSGDAFVLFKKDGKLYEVNGSHCSCYGLEGDWSPEETSIDSINKRIESGLGASDYCDNEFREELILFLKENK